MVVAEGWAGLPAVFARHARERPHASAVRDASGEWTYAELWANACGGAEALRRALAVARAGGACEADAGAPRPLAIATARGRNWYALCIAAWQLGVPVVALSDDMPDRVAQGDRLIRVARELQPLALVISENTDSAMLSYFPKDCVVLQLADVFNVATHPLPESAVPPSANVCAESILCYVFTGGTTRHSKCVAVTHGMALWEMEKYATALCHSVGEADRMLQYSSAYWGAAVFGQLDLALAFGACAVIVRAPGLQELASIVDDEGITVLGVVPSQLRGAWPGGPAAKPPRLRVLVSWAEKLPLHVAREWAPHVKMFELLIASEYWLAFHSACRIWRDPTDGTERLVHHALPDLDMLLLKEDGSTPSEGEGGELFLAGPTVFPGYVGPGRIIGAGPENEAAFCVIRGQKYYRTKDRLLRVPAAAGGGFVYGGRADALTKRGGAWVDLEALESAASQVQGVIAAAVVQIEETLHAFVVMDAHPVEPFCRVLDRVSRALHNDCTVHVRANLPTHPATGKVDRRYLGEHGRQLRAREKDYMENLLRQQKRMFFGYVAWDIFAAMLVTVPSVVFSLITQRGMHAMMSAVARRLLLVPYLWVAMLYALTGPSDDASIQGQHGSRWAGYGPQTYLWPLGPPDILLLSASFVPFPEMCALLSCAFVLWARDKNASVACWLIIVVVSFAVVALALPEALILPPVVIALPGITVLSPGRLPYLAGIPVSFALAAPKWMRDDWTWRTNYQDAWLRRAVMRCLPLLQKKEFDGSWRWDNKGACVDWGDPVAGFSPIKLDWPKSGMSVNISLQQEVPFAVALPSAHDEPDHEPSPSGTDPPEVPKQLSPLATRLSAIVVQVGGRPPWLASLDSLKAIALVECVRRELGVVVLVGDVLKCADVEELAERVQDALPIEDPVNGGGGSSSSSSKLDKVSLPDRDGAYRVYMKRFIQAPVDWYVKFDPGRMDVDAMQRAVDALVARHSALRTVQTPDEPLRQAMDVAAATWQLCATCWGRREAAAWIFLSRRVGKALYACWPRTFQRDEREAQVRMRIPAGPRVRDDAFRDFSDLECAFWIAGRFRRRHRWPFDVFLIPIFDGEPEDLGTGNMTAAHAAARLPEGEVSWYLGVGVTHCYSDGASGQALFQELFKFYVRERGTCCDDGVEVPPPPAEPLVLLQQRLFRSLCGRAPGEYDPNNDVYHEILCEDWGRREGAQRRVIFQPDVLRLLHGTALHVLGCSIDVAWLSVILASMFRLFPDRQRISLLLKCACRDGLGESEMVGFLAEQRVMTVDLGDLHRASLLDIVQHVDRLRRSRDWRVPLPYEAGLCVYVNIVSAMLDGLPLAGHQVVPEIGTQGNWRTDAYSSVNIRLDQRTELDWDFRIFHWDCAWGWHWSTFFAQAMGTSIVDLASSPSGPVLRPPPPQATAPASPQDSVPLAGSKKRKAVHDADENTAQRRSATSRAREM